MSSTLFMDLYSMVKVRMYVEKNPHSTLSWTTSIYSTLSQGSYNLIYKFVTVVH
jgi:hypothetical protein